MINCTKDTSPRGLNIRVPTTQSKTQKRKKWKRKEDLQKNRSLVKTKKSQSAFQSNRWCPIIHHYHIDNIDGNFLESRNFASMCFVVLFMFVTNLYSFFFLQTLAMLHLCIIRCQLLSLFWMTAINGNNQEQNESFRYQWSLCFGCSFLVIN